MLDQKEIQAVVDLQKRYIDAKPFSLKDTGITHRLVTYWGEKGLLPKNPIDKWRKFNLVELVWIRVIAKLRSFNVGIDVIAEIKNELFEDLGPLIGDQLSVEKVKEVYQKAGMAYTDELLNEIDFKKANSEVYSPFLLLFIAKVFLNKTDISILIKATGETSSKKTGSKRSIELMFFDVNNFNESYEKHGASFFLKDSFISISMNEALKDVIEIAEVGKLENMILLSEEERKILEYVRKGKLKSIKIRFNEKSEPVLLEVSSEKKVKPESRLLEIFHNKGFHDIEIKTQKGTIVSFINTEKIKLK